MSPTFLATQAPEMIILRKSGHGENKSLYRNIYDRS